VKRDPVVKLGREKPGRYDNHQEPAPFQLPSFEIAINQMKTRRYKVIFIGVLAVAIICWLAGQWDYSRLAAGKPPLFARWVLHANDGGSIWHIGPGYTVIELHEMRWGIDSQPDFETNYMPFRVGETLDYWTPFVSRERTKFVLETNK
jgi:hypothetical protein